MQRVIRAYLKTDNHLISYVGNERIFGIGLKGVYVLYDCLLLIKFVVAGCRSNIYGTYFALIVPQFSTCTGVPEYQNYWRRQTYVAGKICPPDWNRVTYLPTFGWDQSRRPHIFRWPCMHYVCLQIWMYGLYRENQVGKELGDLGLHTRLLGLMAAPF